MSDPDVRHMECPECHTHQPMLPDGRLVDHLIGKVNETPGPTLCAGSSDYPTRTTGGRYADASQFASCPATTGELNCPGYPDKAHRCLHNREPRHAIHGCQCQFTWSIRTHSATVQIKVVHLP